MKKLTNKQFKNYKESLSVVKECGKVTLQDENGIVATVDSINETFEIDDTAIIDEDEYGLTEKQKEELYTCAELEVEIFEYYDDREHGIFGNGY